MSQASTHEQQTDAADDTPLVTLSAVVWDFKLVGRSRMLTEAWVQQRQPTVFVEALSHRAGLNKVLAPFRARPAAPVLRGWPALPARWWTRVGRDRVATQLRARGRSLRRQLERHVDLRAATAVVVTPTWAPCLDALPFGTVIYDCIDELSVHAPRPDVLAWLRGWEDDLLARCDGAVASARVLAEQLAARRPGLPTALIQNGVDTEAFRARAAVGRPHDLPSTGPIVGFVGALYEWIDFALIRAVCQRLPHVMFVFVGPHDGRGDVERIRDLSNVRLLGPRPYHAVPAYVAGFDVCWAPFTADAISRAANPVKLYEYLALGKPVVATPIADIDTFEGHLLIARDADEAAAQLQAALAEGDDASAGAARRGFADRQTWAARAGAYVAFARRIRMSA